MLMGDSATPMFTSEFNFLGAGAEPAPSFLGPPPAMINEWNPDLLAATLPRPADSCFYSGDGRM